MIFNVSAKALVLFLAVGVVSTTASNLRQRRESLFNHDHNHDNAEAATTVSKAASKSNLRASNSEDVSVEPIPAAPAASSSSSTASEDNAHEAITITTSQEPTTPSITTPKSIYTESEPITLQFSVGPPSHPYYSSSEVPTLNLEYNYPKWSIGLFMRDADPQGGTLSPIVSINLCTALGMECDAKNDARNFAKFNELSVTFGNEFLEVMEGKWPLQVSEYGTGFDAYVLDGKGAGAIGPLEFYIQDEVEGGVDGNKPAVYKPRSSSSSLGNKSSASGGSVAKKPTSHSTSGLAKFNKGTKKATERQHAAVSKATTQNSIAAAHKANTKIENGNGLEEELSSIQGETPERDTQEVPTDAAAATSRSSISSDKEEYEEDNSVTINFSLEIQQDVDLSNYTIGFFMRMSHPQGGALDPVVSLPLCESGCTSTDGITSGSVTFSSDTQDLMSPGGYGSWPIDLYQWGTGYDAYILNEKGEDALSGVGPVEFNIMMNDTY